MRNYGGYMEKGQSTPFYDLKLWLRILKCTRGFKRAMGVAVVLAVGVTVAALSLPYLVKTGIDTYITAVDLSPEQRFSGLVRIGGISAALILCGFVLTFLQVVLLEWVGQSVMHRIRQQLFSHILSLDLAFLTKQPTGRLVTRLTNDVQNMYEMFTSVIVTLFNDLLRLAGILVVLIFMNAKLAALMSLFLPLAMVLIVTFASLAREKFRAIRSQLSRINSFVQESVSGMSVIQLFNRQSWLFSQFDGLSREYLERTLKQIRLFAAFMPLTELMSWVAISMILLYGGFQVIDKRLTIGELIAFIAYMRLFFQPLRELAQKYSIVQSALASAERIFSMLDTERKIKSPPSALPIERINGAITYKSVSFAYEKDIAVIDDLDLTIDAGQTVAIVGPTGSGKSTLISLLQRFYEPQKGTITIDGHDIRDLDLETLRTIVGVILQDVLILDDTLLANIVMNSGCSRARVEDILEKGGMRPFVDRLEQGLDTRIGDGGRELSSGEKQLLAFARAMCRNPAILILDEATASIDSETESMLERAIETITDRTSIIIAHRLSTVKRADRIIVMESGRIVEQGNHQHLLSRNGRYAELVKLDSFAEEQEQGIGTSGSTESPEPFPIQHSNGDPL
ncbi:MAG: ABC transporter ATP-binding protein/permease [Desulfofustis sp.]|jgi:ATP-binding cassette subfamily B multidrug efflux pump|nr:ABC transporter ATP-binding protein/permease [Desulfofustis sp.]